MTFNKGAVMYSLQHVTRPGLALRMAQEMRLSAHNGVDGSHHAFEPGGVPWLLLGVCRSQNALSSKAQR